MAHRITIEVDLLHEQLCSGCPCNQDTCTLFYWNKRRYVWYNWRTGELQEPPDTDHELPIDDGWGYHTKRSQQCIDEKG